MADQKLSALTELAVAPAVDDELYIRDVSETPALESKRITTANLLSLIVPSGLIVMWHGTIANIPSGWVICDGNNSTPNLLAKFVQGVATAATNPGTTGGAQSKTMTVGGTKRVGSSYTASGTGLNSLGTVEPQTHADIRPPFYDVAFLMKT